MATKKQDVKQVEIKSEGLIDYRDPHKMIEEAAYFIAESRGFDGDCTGHWIEAEREINNVSGV